MIIFLVDKPSELPYSTFGTNAKSFLLSYHYIVESKLELADLIEDLRKARQGIKKPRLGKGRRRKNGADQKERCQAGGRFQRTR
jgi:hypothetical protein